MSRHTDVMRRLAAARPESLVPGPAATRREHDLRTVTTASPEPDRLVDVIFAPTLSEDPPRRSGRRGSSARRRSGRWLAPVVAAAATGAVFAAITMVPGPPPDRAGRAATSPDHRAMVLAMAERAERLPEEHGRYWHTHAVTTSTEDVVTEPGGYSVEVSRETFKRTPIDRRDDVDSANVYGRVATFEPTDEADRAAWRKAGSPSRVRTSQRIPGATNVVTMAAGAWRRGDPAFDAGVTPLRPPSSNEAGQPTYEEIRQLPVDPERLRAEVFCPPTAPGRGPGCEPRRVLYDVFGAMATNPVPPRLRAAMIRMLVNEPRVTAVGETTDPLGRPGIAFAVVSENPDGMVVRELAIFDPRTGRALATPAFVVKPGSTSALRPGELLNHRTLLDSGWTTGKPPLPE